MSTWDYKITHNSFNLIKQTNKNTYKNGNKTKQRRNTMLNKKNGWCSN